MLDQQRERAGATGDPSPFPKRRLSTTFTEGSMAELVVLNGDSVTTQFDIVEKIQAL